MLKLLSDSIFQSCAVHNFCINQSITLLSDGGHPQLADVLEPYVDFMHQGSNWTDQGLRNLSHFYHPLEKKGLPGVHHAGDELDGVLNQMEKARKQENPPRYFFCLGIVLHLIQDMCVPHHVFGCLLQGHHSYETWVIRHHHLFRATESGKCSQERLEDVLEANALIALNHEALLHQPTEELMQQSTQVLLPLAQQSSAWALLMLKDQINSLACHVDRGKKINVGFLKEA